MTRVYILLLLALLVFGGCKKQCAILKEKIYDCKDQMGVSTGSCGDGDYACQEINLATTLIDDVVRAIEQGTEYEDDLESICSMALSSKEGIEIDFSQCNTAIAPEKQITLMKQFGRSGLLDGTTEIFKLRTTFLTEGTIHPKQYCIGDIYDRYLNTLDDDAVVELKINKLNFESLKKKVLIRRDNEFFMDYEIGLYLCDFNTRDTGSSANKLPPRLIEYINEYDLVLCSKSDGWYQAEEDCALDRQEVFLFKFKEKPNVRHCVQLCRNGKDDDYIDGCNIDCVDDCNSSCLNEEMVADCSDVCALDLCCTTSECYGNVNNWIKSDNKEKTYLSYSGDDSVCISWCDTHCDTQYDETIDQENCYNSCTFTHCLNAGFYEAFKGDPLFDEITSGSCSDSCEASCDEESSDQIEVLDESKLLIFFREAKSEKSGSSCNSDIFPENTTGDDGKGKDFDYCYIEFDIDEEA